MIEEDVEELAIIWEAFLWKNGPAGRCERAWEQGFIKERNIYRMLTTEGRVFLPPEKECPHAFLAQIFKGEKWVSSLQCPSNFQFILGDSVQHFQAPFFKNLTVDTLLSWGSANVDIEQYLPEFTYEHVPNRAWLTTLCKPFFYHVQ